MKILVLGLGNELISDDGLGIFAARALEEKLEGKADVVESSLHGVALMELFIGYDKAVVIDAIQTGEHPPGTILELTPSDLDPVLAPSPHYSGLPEFLALAKRLELDFPSELRILAMEVTDTVTWGGEMTQPVGEALPEFVQRVERLVMEWTEVQDR
jgi:hydrogenase maturation protease